MNQQIEFATIPNFPNDAWTVCWVDIGSMAPIRARAYLSQVRDQLIKGINDSGHTENVKLIVAPMRDGEKLMEFETVGEEEYVLWRLSKDD